VNSPIDIGENMANITIFLPDEVKARAEKQYPQINWSGLLKRMIMRELDELDRANALAAKAYLTPEDAGHFANIIRKDMAGQLEELLFEARNRR
jgi:hypothetical protein